jgi:2-polyprenyl-3-methyl-5-hydroxy-6-metoxy-1,4-benzoquinol methylase
MEIHHEELTDVSRYLANNQLMRLEDKESRFRTYLRVVEPHIRVDSRTKILEIGTGTGWFPLLCKKNGLNCKGLEISPQLIEYAREVGKAYGIEPDIELGNLEDTDLGRSTYDVIIASSVFEHVEYWQRGLKKIYDALKPGGVLFFESTNKFSFTSGEYTGVPLYGWLPNAARYKLRKMVHGDDIMKLGIDFHQFRHPTLRREFKRLGFSKIYDRVEMADPNHVSAEWKKWLVRASRQNALVKWLSLTFADATRFVCVK